MAGSAQEYNALQPFLLLEANSSLDLVFLLIDLLQDEKVLLTEYISLKHLHHPAEERVADSLRENRYRIGLRTLQITCTVIRYVLILRDRIKDLLLCLRIDIRMIVDRAGHRTDSNAAEAGDFLDRNLFHTCPSHKSAPYPCRLYAL